MAKVVTLRRRWRFPGALNRFRRMLDDEAVEFEESDLDEGLACAEAAIAKRVPGAHEVKADLLDIRAHRLLHAGDADAAFSAWDAIAAAYPDYRSAYTMRAQILGERGDHAAALAMLDGYIARAPDDAEGYAHRATFFEERGETDRALADLRRVVELDPTSAGALLTMAQLCESKGDAHGAAAAYEKYAEAPLDDVESYKMRGFMFYMSNRLDLALADYDACVALSPKDPDALSWRGILRFNLGMLEEAVADYTRLIKLTPKDARAYLRRGVTLVKLGRYAEALPDLEKAIERGGDDKGVAHFARGEALEALGDVVSALASYDTAIERDPSRVACRLRRLKINEAAGNRAARQVDVDALLTAAPNEPCPLLSYARARRANYEREDARVALDLWVALEPKNARARYERADLLMGAGDYIEACHEVARAFELAPDDPEIRARHGRIQLSHAKTDDARAAAIQLIVTSAELDRENPEAWLRAACHLQGAAQHRAAIPLITRAIELDPDNADYLDVRARSLEQTAAYQEALADVERALALDEHWERYHTRADLRRALGDVVGAARDEKKVLELGGRW